MEQTFMPPLQKHSRETSPESHHSHGSSSEIVSNTPRLEKVSFIILLITIVLVPLVVIPYAYSPFDITKSSIISLGVLISVLLALIPLFKRKTLVLPRVKFLIVPIALTVSLIISAFLSTSISKAFTGQGFEMFTVSFMLIMFILTSLTVYLTRVREERSLYIYAALFMSFIILALFHGTRLLLGPEFMSFGLFTSAISSLIGKWNDFAIFSAVILVLSYLGTRFLSLGKGMKVVLYILLALAAFFVFVVNFPVVWWTIAFVMLGIIIYTLILKTPKTSLILPFIIMVLAISCAYKGSSLSEFVHTTFGVQQTEIVLPWQLTLDVASDTLKESPLFGAGPNRFAVQYLLHKPAVVNSTDFWAVEFNNGSGNIPSFLVSQGVIGSILWLALIATFIFLGIKALKASALGMKPESQFILLGSFFTTALLWAMNILYIPSHAIFFLTFLMTGLFISTLISTGNITTKEYASEGGMIKGMLPVTYIAAILIIGLWTIIFLKKDMALAYFEGGVSSLGIAEGKGVAQAEENFKKALSLDKLDIYYQALSEVSLLKISVAAQEIQKSQTEGKTADPAAMKVVTDLVQEAMDYTKMAILVDPTNYYNYISQARVSEVAQSLKAEGAYENLKKSYSDAITVSPSNPAFYLNLARIEASQGKVADAQRYIGASLQLKPNYLDAIFLLSQIQVSQGQVKEAITSVKVATQINPTNPLIFFQLGILYYSDKNYEAAIEALKKAVELNGQYANARYFLGLSYARLSNIPAAIEQFEELAKTNSDSQEVTFILSNLQEGKSPFADVQPPIDSKPEKRSTLPVKEKAVETKKKTTK